MGITANTVSCTLGHDSPAGTAVQGERTKKGQKTRGFLNICICYWLFSNLRKRFTIRIGIQTKTNYLKNTAFFDELAENTRGARLPILTFWCVRPALP